MTPIRVVCQNTLNLALSSAKRVWSTNHTGDMNGKIMDARDSLLYAEKYMTELGKTIERMNQIKLSDQKVKEYIDALFPIYEDPTPQQVKNIRRMKEDMMARYYDARILKMWAERLSIYQCGIRLCNSCKTIADNGKL